MIADRAETLVGIWGIGLKPTGDKDPYALRRHALTLIDSFRARRRRRRRRAARPARAARRRRASTFAVPLAADVVAEVEAFIYERYFQQLAAAHDTRAVDAVISMRPALHDVVGRAARGARVPRAARGAGARRGQQARRQHPEEERRGAAAPSIRRCSASRPSRRSPPRSRDVGARADQRLRARASTLGRCASSPACKPPVDAFFDNVMVNVDSAPLRANRLALLAALRATMNRVADLSRLAV